MEWIFDESQSGRLEIVISDYLILELLRNPNIEKRSHTLAMTHYAAHHVKVADSIARRATQIERFGIAGFDALHIAAAESARCEFFVSTDDRLLKKSMRHSSQLMIPSANPIDIILLS